MAVPYTFGSATTSIPLSQLDSNFATTITLGNTAVQLGNTITNLTGVSNVASATSLSLGSNGNTTAITVDTSQNVLVGTTTTTNNLRNGEKVAVVTTGSGTQGGASLTTYSGTGAGNGVIIDIQRSRGTTDGSMTAVASGDTLGYLLFRGSDGTSFQDSSYITAQVDGAVSAGTVPGRLGFITSGTERMRLNSSGTVILQGGSTSATGVGIAFPATQSASSDANTLDDYEEGSWTPNQGSGLTVVGAFTSSGVYTKVGNLVYIAGKVVGNTSVACSATGTITGNLPFTVGAELTIGGAVNSSQTSAVVTYCTATRMDSPNVINAAGTIFFSAIYRV